MTTAQAPPLNDSASQVDKSNSRVREMFRQIAPRYDAMNHLLSMNIDRYWRWRAVRRLNMKAGTPILDTCTGTGDLALAIARKAPEKVDVIGSDFCHAMLTIARDKRPRAQSDDSSDQSDISSDQSDDSSNQSRDSGESAARVSFLEADSQQLPFADNQFQCVTVAFGLRNVADTDRGLAEMTRVCTPGGQVMVLEFSQPRMIGLRQVYGFYFRNILPRIGQWFARNDKAAYKYLPESVGQFPDGQELADRMTAIGLTNVRFTPMTFGVATIYEGFKPSDTQHAGQQHADQQHSNQQHADQRGDG
ncbi:MAG: class I SAM-dependent methyltransferase [Pirellulaceae bacterium]|nr:class I SAM-dependent methyltransferase [Pirellulaceae bacterium]